MNRLNKYIIFTLIIVICSACKEPFTPELKKYEDILVIDGLLTNQAGPTVKLSRGSHYSEPEVRPEEGAMVMIRDEQDNMLSMYEVSPGVYKNYDFKGMIGKSYQLYIYIEDGQEYESDFVVLKDVPEIENLYAEYGEKAGETDYEKGFYIYIDTYDPDKETGYYRYEFEETWEFTVPYPSRFELVDRSLRLRSVIPSKCWRTENSTDILLTSTDIMESNIIRRFPVQFVSTVGNRLSRRYSILVKQYSLSREAYIFWEQLKNTNQDMGTLFDKQPAQVYGNIYNLNGDESPVLGFFEASSVTSKRIFLENKDLPSDVRIQSEFAYCQSKYFIVNSRDALSYAISGYCVVKEETSDFFGMGIIADHRCCDCTVTGTNIRPDFW